MAMVFLGLVLGAFVASGVYGLTLAAATDLGGVVLGLMIGTALGMATFLAVVL